MYGKLAAGLLTLGIAMSTTVSAQAHGANLLCRDGVKTAPSFQGGCDLGSRPHARPYHRPLGRSHLTRDPRLANLN